MATIAENLTLLKSTKAGIKAAIEAKGVSNVGDKFSDYPAKIASIPTGGSTSGVSQWTGTVDRAGLTELGWSTTDIDNFQANVRWYDWQDPDYTVVDADKSITAISQYENNRNVRYAKMLDTSQATNMDREFNVCTRLVSIPTLDTSQVTSMQNMFSGCHRLASIPTLDTSKVTDMRYMFNNCTRLASIPALNTSQVTNMDHMFYGGSNLISIPALDTSKVTNMVYMFGSCTSLSFIPALDTSKVTNMSNMFDGCTSLTTIESIDFSSCLYRNSVFASYAKPHSLTSMHVTGSISFSWTSGGFSNVPNLDFNSIKSILEAMNRCTNPETAKTMSFNSTMTDQDSQLTNLVSECNGKGWTITGLTIN